jgi:hypothetical protein
MNRLVVTAVDPRSFAISLSLVQQRGADEVRALMKAAETLAAAKNLVIRQVCGIRVRVGRM